MKTSAEVPGMSGRLRLTAALDGAGRCVLREQFSTSLHRVLALIPGEAPEEGIVYVLNPTGGIVQGDRLEADVRVERGAHAIVTSPAATKVYRMESGEAVSRTRLEVEGVLEYLPEPLIPQRGARFRETLDLRVAEGGRALAWEILAPGRVAYGESLEYESLELDLRLEVAGRRVLRDRAVATPSEGLSGPATLGGFGYYGVLLAAGGEAEALVDPFREACAAHGAVLAGVTRLAAGAVMLKALARASAPLAALLEAARAAAMPVLSGRPATPFRRS